MIAPVLESTFFSIYHQFKYILWFYFYQRDCRDRDCKARLWNLSISRSYWSPTKGLGSCLCYNFSICLTSDISQCVRDLSWKYIVRSELCVSSQLQNSDLSHLVSELVGLTQEIPRAQLECELLKFRFLLPSRWQIAKAVSFPKALWSNHLPKDFPWQCVPFCFMGDARCVCHLSQLLKVFSG